MVNKILLWLLIINLSACGGNENGQAFNEQHTITVTDFTGATVSLKKPAQRIIALAPHIVENVYTAGAGNKLVGAVAYSDFPEQAKLLPRVGGYSNINIEKILELKPELIIAWKSAISEANILTIKSLGFPIYIDQPDTLSDLSKSIKDIGMLTGHTEQATHAANKYLVDLEKTKKKYQLQAKVRTFYQVWNQPLRTITGKHIISDAIKICGGVNVYADEKTVSPIINIESLLKRNPQAIIASGLSDKPPEWLNDWKQWPSLQAVRNNNLFFVNPDHIQRHTIRVLLGINSICQQLDEARNKANQKQS